MDKRDLRIIELESIIDKFKVYDSNRKEYYKQSLQELGALKAYVEELDNTDVIKLRKENKALKRYIELNRIETTKPECIVKEEISKANLKQRNLILQDRIKKLEEIRDYLIAKLNESK